MVTTPFSSQRGHARKKGNERADADFGNGTACARRHGQRTAHRCPHLRRQRARAPVSPRPGRCTEMNEGACRASIKGAASPECKPIIRSPFPPPPRLAILYAACASLTLFVSLLQRGSAALQRAVRRTVLVDMISLPLPPARSPVPCTPLR
ncbi:hypothetical protein FA95DRAFT_771157 [Auriscalpium vulgare]|uniref:Uncharacterized protein n=1 Tax=Auriscalpium vulgare TaxID=40419 RepID=A0ACB8RB47_9AGAM|nr:hypothetical protein FA95DRAFT_771157 [Auriscalpium vulgare]